MAACEMGWHMNGEQASQGERESLLSVRVSALFVGNGK